MHLYVLALDFTRESLVFLLWKNALFLSFSYSFSLFAIHILYIPRMLTTIFVHRILAFFRLHFQCSFHVCVCVLFFFLLLPIPFENYAVFLYHRLFCYFLFSLASALKLTFSSQLTLCYGPFSM